MPWTKEQQKVIDQRDADILVSAAAGSGKTAVLVERIIQKITDEAHPLDVDKLLVVTFTKAAAGEMRERIARALELKVQEHPENAHYIRQLSLIHKAQITTIHSFCMELIRDYFYVIGMDPGMSPGDEGQLSLLREQVLDEILEEAYGKREDGFIKLIESYSPGKKDDVISQYIWKLYLNARSHVQPEKWLAEARRNISVKTLEEFREAPFVKIILTDAKNIIESAGRMIREAKELALQEGGPYFYLKTLDQDSEIIENMTEAEGISDLCNQFMNMKKPRLSGRKKKTDQIIPELQEQCKELRNRAYKLIVDIQASYFYQEEKELFRELRVLREPLEALIDLTERFLERYSQRKSDENLMDFDDMEHFALQLLIDHFDEDGQPVPSQIAREKAESYEEIYIDEYQDSNFIQDAILRSVSKEFSGGHNMFMVGDVKQSIYSFRLARPDLFLGKYYNYQRWDEQYQLIELQNNFRSRKEVLNFVNSIFYQIMHESLGNIEYTKEVSLVPTMSFPETENILPEILLVDSKEVKEAEDDAVTIEAKMIGAKIKEMVDGEHPYMVTCEDEEGNRVLRKAEYGDIVILLRSMKGNAEIIQKELMNAGVPAFCNSEKGYFDTVEIRTLLSLLSVVDNIYLDIDLAAVLRSPMIGMSEEELGLVKADGGEKYLYDSLVNVRTSMKKAEKTLELLDKLRDAKTYLRLTELIWMALDETGYYHYAGAMPQGKKRQGNILMLIEQAKGFETNQMKGLFHFIRFMEQCQEYDMDFGEANTLGEEQNLVHISSIHKSKGLEYPIVFVSKIHQKFNLRDSSGSLIFHPDYYIGADIIDPVLRTKGTTVLKSMIRRQMLKDSLGEELRVLYVAMTRAKEKLILTGIKKRDIDWSKNGMVSYVDLFTGSSYMDWIFCALPYISEDDFEIKIYSMEALTWMHEMKEIDKKIEKQKFMENLLSDKPEQAIRKMKQNFLYEYENNPETTGQLKYSVSEIKRMSQQADQEERIFKRICEDEKKVPKFIKKDQKVSSASRGTVIHKVFELLDFAKKYTKEELDVQISQWIHKKIIDQNYDSVIDRNEIMAFLDSDLGRRVREAAKRNHVFKEKQFVMGIPFSKMNPESTGDSYVVVQGIIDLYFEEDDELILVDYKTDRIPKGQEKILVDRYQSQLDYYKRALEQTTGKTVKECCIYAVGLKKIINL